MNSKCFDLLKHKRQAVIIKHDNMSQTELNKVKNMHEMQSSM